MGTYRRIDSRTWTPRSPPSAARVFDSTWPLKMPGHRPVIPRYSRGADAIARHAPAAERRDAPTRRSNAPAPSVRTFRASPTEGDRSYKVSAFIGAVARSILRTTVRTRPLDPQEAFAGAAEARRAGTMSRQRRRNWAVVAAVEHAAGITDRSSAHQRE